MGYAALDCAVISLASRARRQRVRLFDFISERRPYSEDDLVGRLFMLVLHAAKLRERKKITTH